MILMTVQNVSKSFGMNCVLKDISLTLQQGARMGLIGVNGSGKSTLLRALATLLPLDGGEARVCGLPLQKAGAVRALVGYLPGDFGVYGNLRLREAMDYLGALSGLDAPTRRARTQQLLGLVGLPIFTMGGGFSYVLQPSFGFLLGLIPSAWVIGTLCKNAKSFWPMALGILAGLAVLYLIGTPYMGPILNLYLGKGMSVWQIVRAGCLLYLPGDVLKIVVCTALCLALRSRLPKALAAA